MALMSGKASCESPSSCKSPCNPRSGAAAPPPSAPTSLTVEGWKVWNSPDSPAFFHMPYLRRPASWKGRRGCTWLYEVAPLLVKGRRGCTLPSFPAGTPCCAAWSACSFKLPSLRLPRNIVRAQDCCGQVCCCPYHVPGCCPHAVVEEVAQDCCDQVSWWVDVLDSLREWPQGAMPF